MVEIPVSSPEGTSWLVPLAEQFRNHDEFQTPSVGDLGGRRLRLYFGDAVIDLELADDRLRWTTSGKLAWGGSGDTAYEAVVVRDGIYAVTVPRLDHNAGLLAIVDLPSRHVFLNLTRFATRAGVTREQTLFFEAGIDQLPVHRVRRTVELIGMRVAHRYSTTHTFEHIYLNPNTYVFQGLRGPEAGVADVDRADYWKLGEQLYLLSWHERSQPFNGAIVIDLNARCATGRHLGWDPESRRTLQVRVGSELTVLSRTSYEGI